MLTEGALVSTKNFALFVTAIDVMTLLLPAASFKVAPFKVKALSAMATPSRSVWPLTIVVANSKVLVPDPET